MIKAVTNSLDLLQQILCANLKGSLFCILGGYEIRDMTWLSRLNSFMNNLSSSQQHIATINL